MEVLLRALSLFSMMWFCWADDIRCFECTSYMKQCEDKVDSSSNIVFRTKCKSKCYARLGEDGAIYRGCFSYFEDATGLKFDYTGCHNQTWNNKELTWCLCDSDLCNGQSFRMMTRSRGLSEYSPEENYVDGAENYLEADYIHQNEDTKLLPVSAYAKESTDDTYVEPHLKLWENGYGDGYEVYERDDHSSPYNMGPQYSRTDDTKEYLVDDARYTMDDDVVVQYPRNDDSNYSEDEYSSVEEEKERDNDVSPELASQIRCSKTGYYQNPHDCRQFIACLMDPHSNTPIMHLMRCPSGLVFDNKKKICLTHSSTCSIGGGFYDYGSRNSYDRPTHDTRTNNLNEPKLNFESKLYDTERKVDTTGFSQSGGDEDSYSELRTNSAYQNEDNDDGIYYVDDGYGHKYDDQYDLVAYDSDYDTDIYQSHKKDT